MVVILVLLTIIGFITLDFFIDHHHRARARAALPAISRAPERPFDAASQETSGLLFHPGHTWVRPLTERLAEVGADELATKLVGRPAAVCLPRIGSKLEQGEPALTLVSQRGRRLVLATPISGEVVAVNPALLDQPGTVEHSPYGSGWAFRVQPAADRAGFDNLFGGSLARAWLDALRFSVTTRVATPVGVVAADGGEWLSGFGDNLDDTAWEATLREVFPATSAPSYRAAERVDEWDVPTEWR